MKKYRFKFRLLPTVLFTALVILIVRARSYSLDFSDMPDIPSNASMQRWDLFCYAKAEAVLAITVFALLTMLYLLITSRLKIKKTIIYIPLLVYTLGVIFSYVFSDYKWLALRGSIDRFEGTITILCYVFMFFYTINVVEDFEDVLTALFSAGIAVFIECLIGISQLLGKDILLSNFAEKIMTDSDFLSVTALFKPGQVYQTVSNMNYVGMYLTLIVPVLVYLIYYLSHKKNGITLIEYGIYNKQRKIIICLSGLMLILILLNIIGADSLGGFIGIGTSLAMLLGTLIENKKTKICIFLLFVLTFVGTLTAVYLIGVDDHDITGHKQLEYIETDQNRINMSVDGNVLSIIYHRENDDYELRDGENNPISITDYPGEDGMVRPDDYRFGEKIRITPIKDANNEACLIIDVMDNEWETYGFTFYEDGVKYLNPFGREVSLVKVDSLGFKGHLSSGSGRGYIWSRCLPLIKDRIVLGSGADTFLAIFPNNDYAGKYSAGMSTNVTIEKPHDMYLGMALGTGILSLIAFLSMMIMILWKAFRLGEDKKYIKVIACGIIGFLISGLFNDSMVCIMPMFYGILGTVAAICI